MSPDSGWRDLSKALFCSSQEPVHLFWLTELHTRAEGWGISGSGWHRLCQLQLTRGGAHTRQIRLRGPWAGQPMGSRAAVAPPGSPPVFGWSSSGRGRWPPVALARPCLWEAQADLPFNSRKALLELPHFNFSDLLRAGGLWGQRGKGVWEDCAARDGNFPLALVLEWARASGWGGGRF